MDIGRSKPRRAEPLTNATDDCFTIRPLAVIIVDDMPHGVQNPRKVSNFEQSHDGG
jgi:hypothetical protein